MTDWSKPTPPDVCWFCRGPLDRPGYAACSSCAKHFPPFGKLMRCSECGGVK